jgi:hypothetical protein
VREIQLASLAVRASRPRRGHYLGYPPSRRARDPHDALADCPTSLGSVRGYPAVHWPRVVADDAVLYFPSHRKCIFVWVWGNCSIIYIAWFPHRHHLVGYRRRPATSPQQPRVNCHDARAEAPRSLHLLHDVRGPTGFGGQRWWTLASSAVDLVLREAVHSGQVSTGIWVARASVLIRIILALRARSIASSTA